MSESQAMRPMERLFGRFYFASRREFLHPGIYYDSKRVLPLPRKGSEPSVRIVEFPEQTVVIAKNQPEYLPLPAYRFHEDVTGRIVCCWQMNWKARVRFLFTGKIWHEILTFNQALQPQLLSVEKPEMPKYE
jgi:hypothetical protein